MYIYIYVDVCTPRIWKSHPAKDTIGSNLECSLHEGLGYRMVGLDYSLAYDKCYFTLLYFIRIFNNTISTNFFVF